MAVILKSGQKTLFGDELDQQTWDKHKVRKRKCRPRVKRITSANTVINHTIHDNIALCLQSKVKGRINIPLDTEDGTNGNIIDYVITHDNQLHYMVEKNGVQQEYTIVKYGKNARINIPDVSLLL